MFRAIEDFVDLQDSNFVYHSGDIFPRSGKEVSAARIAALASSNNRRGRAVIAAVGPVKPIEVKKTAEKPVEKPVEKPAEKPEEPKKRKTTKRTKKSAD